MRKSLLRRKQWWPRRKFNNIPTEYGGIIYDSMAEARYANQLDLEKKAGTIKEWKRQVYIPFEVNGKLICSANIDFEVEYSDGHKELREVKGMVTPTWTIKKKLFHALYPNRKLTIIKAKDI